MVWKYEIKPIYIPYSFDKASMIVSSLGAAGALAQYLYLRKGYPLLNCFAKFYFFANAIYFPLTAYYRTDSITDDKVLLNRSSALASLLAITPIVILEFFDLLPQKPPMMCYSSPFIGVLFVIKCAENRKYKDAEDQAYGFGMNIAITGLHSLKTGVVAGASFFATRLLVTTCFPNLAENVATTISVAGEAALTCIFRDAPNKIPFLREIEVS